MYRDSEEVKQARKLFIQGRMKEEVLRKILNRDSGSNEPIDQTMQFNNGGVYNDIGRNGINRSFSAKNTR